MLPVKKLLRIIRLLNGDGPVAIEMGAEDTGVSMANLRICDSMGEDSAVRYDRSAERIGRPSILIYEVVRQRMNEQGTQRY